MTAVRRVPDYGSLHHFAWHLTLDPVNPNAKGNQQLVAEAPDALTASAFTPEELKRSPWLVPYGRLLHDLFAEVSATRKAAGQDSSHAVVLQEVVNAIALANFSQIPVLSIPVSEAPPASTPAADPIPSASRTAEPLENAANNSVPSRADALAFINKLVQPIDWSNSRPSTWFASWKKGEGFLHAGLAKEDRSFPKEWSEREVLKLARDLELTRDAQGKLKNRLAFEFVLAEYEKAVGPGDRASVNFYDDLYKAASSLEKKLEKGGRLKEKPNLGKTFHDRRLWQGRTEEEQADLINQSLGLTGSQDKWTPADIQALEAGEKSFPQTQLAKVSSAYLLPGETQEVGRRILLRAHMAHYIGKSFQGQTLESIIEHLIEALNTPPSEESGKGA